MYLFCISVCINLWTDSGSLSCSFDQGLCDWIQRREGDVHWDTVPDPAGSFTSFIY